MTPELRVDAIDASIGSITQIGQVGRDVHLQIDRIEFGDLSRLIAAAPVPFDELFELVADPDAVAAAVLRRATADVVDHFPRVGGDYTPLLLDRLRARRALLVTGRGGIGKTSEVAVVARELVEARGFALAVALPNAEHRLHRLGALPSDVANGRALWVFDDLHLRTTGAGGGAALARALQDLCDRLDQEMPSRWMLLGTARDDPSARARLALNEGPGPWGPCERLKLPEFSDATLADALCELARRSGVALDPAAAPALIANSDRTLRTIGFNVGLAARRKAALDGALWRPTQADSWRARFDDVVAQQPRAIEVFGAVALLRRAYVPPRRPYVESLARMPDARATDALIEANLLGERDGLIDAYADEALVDVLGDAAGSSAIEPGQWSEIAAVLLRLAQDVDDLVKFAVRRMLDEQWPLALQASDAAIARGEQRGMVRFLRGTARAALGDPAAAVDDISAAIALDGESALFLAERARSLVTLERTDEAMADAQRALELAPDWTSAHQLLAGQWLLRSDFERAIEHADRALAAGGDSPVVRLVRARALVGAGRRWDDVLADSLAAQARLGDSQLLRFTRASALSQLGRWDEAKPVLDAALDDEGAVNRIGLLRLRGTGSLRAGDYAAARIDRMAVDGQDELNATGLKWLGRSHVECADWPAADDALTRYLAQMPADRDARLWRMLARASLERWDDVLEDCDALQRVDDTDSSVRAARRLALHGLGRYAEQAAELKQLLAQEPRDAALLAEYTDASARAGDLGTARDAYARLAATDGDAVQREIARANLRYAEGDWVDSIACARALIVLAPGAAAEIDLAMAQLFAGDAGAAIRTLRAAPPADAQTRARARRELDFWRARHPAAVDAASARQFLEVLLAASG